MFKTVTPIVLASGSPRRREMLQSLGLDFHVWPSTIKEPEPEPGEEPTRYVLRTARAKAMDVASGFPEALVISADTVVAFEGEILGKPRSREEAIAMLGLLCGGEDHRHQVITGCCLAQSLAGLKEDIHEFAVTTDVFMSAQSADVLRAYVDTGEPMDKAGAYAIQGTGGFLVREIRGSYNNVVGLPLARVMELLLKWGVVVPKRK